MSWLDQTNPNNHIMGLPTRNVDIDCFTSFLPSFPSFFVAESFNISIQLKTGGEKPNKMYKNS